MNFARSATLLLIAVCGISFAIMAQTNIIVDLNFAYKNITCAGDQICFDGELSTTDVGGPHSVSGITIRFVYDQSLYSNAEIFTADSNYIADEIGEQAAPLGPSMTSFDFNGAAVFSNGTLLPVNSSTLTDLSSASQAFFSICLDLQPGINLAEEQCLTLLWDQASNTTGAPGFTLNEGVEVALDGSEFTADERVDHYAWDYGMSGGTLGGIDTSECMVYAQPATHLVLNTNDGGAFSLRKLIGDACANDTIRFAPAIQQDTVQVLSPIQLTKNVAIVGPASGMAISGGGATGVMDILSGLIYLKSIEILAGDPANWTLRNQGVLIANEVVVAE